MKLNKLTLFVSVIGIFMVIAGIFSISVDSFNITAKDSKKQNVPMYVLESIPVEDSNDGFNKNLAISSSSEGDNLYISQRNTQVLKIKNLKNKNKKNLYIGEFNSLTVNDEKLFVAGDSHIRVYDKDGKRTNNFSIPTKKPSSIAALDNNNVAVETTDEDGLFTVFNESGKKIRKVGKLKSLYEKDKLQNIFLNRGILASNKSGNIYYVSRFSTEPTVQKFSK